MSDGVIFVASENTTHTTRGFENPERATDWVIDAIEDNDRVRDFERRVYPSGHPQDGWYYHVTDGDMLVAGVVEKVEMMGDDDA